MIARRYDFVSYDLLPDHLRAGAEDYIENGREPGHFLLAVLENNLVDAFGRADHASLAAMHNIVIWLFNEAPSSCWGSRAKVDAWIEKHDR